MKKKIFLFVLMFLFCGAFGISGLNFCFAKATDETYIPRMSTSADIWDGTSSSANDFVKVNDGEYHIYSAAGLKYFADQVYNRVDFTDEIVYLETDIDLGDNSWDPIGYYVSFTGNFDGKGHTIYASGSFAGLFGDLRNASIKNVKIEAEIEPSLLSSAYYYGILASGINNGALENCVVNAKISGSIQAVNFGGIVGSAEGSSIKHCQSNLQIDLKLIDDCTFGGLVGNVIRSSNLNIIEESSANIIGDFTVEDTGYEQPQTFTLIGGLIGSHSGMLSSDKNLQIVNSFAKFSNLKIDKVANVPVYVGGFLGLGSKINIDSSYVNFKNFEFNNYNSEYDDVAGFISSSTGDVSINNTYSLIADDRYFVVAGMHTTYSSPTSLIKTYTNIEKKAKDNASLTTLTNLDNLARTRGFYTENYRNAWNFDTIWSIDADVNDSLPYLKNAGTGFADNTPNYSDKENDFFGEGTVNDPYRIYTAGDMGKIAEIYKVSQPNSRLYFSLQNDIDLSSRTWQPIGHLNAFNGVFDGNNHTISGIRCSLQEKFAYHGLFGKTDGAVVKNLILSDVRFLNKGTANNIPAGNLIGYIAGTTYIINCVDQNTLMPTIGAVKNISYCRSFLGKNNLVEEEFLSSVTLGEELSKSEFSGYVGNIDANGGFVYKTKGKVIGDLSGICKGEYEFLFSKIGESVNMSAFDETFVYAFPKTTENWGKDDVISKVGYKFSHFIPKDDLNKDYTEQNYKNSVSFDFKTLNNDKVLQAVNGLVAIWHQVTNNSGEDGTSEVPKLKIIYNNGNEFDNTQNESSFYEAAGYIGKQIKLNDKTATLQRNNENNDLYIEIEMEYDMPLSYYLDYFCEPKYNIDDKDMGLRGDDFVIDGFRLFLDGNLKDDFVLCGEAPEMFATDNLSYYADWKTALSNEGNASSYEITINVKSSDGSDVSMAAKNFVYRINGEEKEFSKVENGKGLQYKLGYDLSYFKDDNDASSISFKLDLHDGFSFSKNEKEMSIIMSREGRPDTNFGVLKGTSGTQNISYLKSDWTSNGSDIGFYGFTDSGETNFINLIGNYEITIFVIHDNMSANLVVGESIFTAISPKHDIAFIENGNVHFSILINGYSNLLNAEILTYKKQNPNVKIYASFDVINGRVLVFSDDVGTGDVGAKLKGFYKIYNIPSLKLSNIGQQIDLQYVNGEEENNYILKLEQKQEKGMNIVFVKIYQKVEDSDVVLVQLESKPFAGNIDLTKIEYSTITYPSYSSFVLQFAENVPTDNVKLNLSAKIEQNTQADLFKEEQIYAGLNRITLYSNAEVKQRFAEQTEKTEFVQGLFVFDHVLHSTNNGNTIVAVQNFTTAKFNEPSFYLGNNGEQKISNNLPKIHFSGVEQDFKDGNFSRANVLQKNLNANVEQDGKIVFYIESSDYYKLTSDENISDLNSYFSNVQFANVGSEEYNSSYEELFNNTGALGFKNFFKGATIECFKRGTELWKELQSHTYQVVTKDDSLPNNYIITDENIFQDFGVSGDYSIKNDVYKITIPFKASSNYSSSSASGTGLQCGLYNFSFKVEEVKYSLQYKTEIIDGDGNVIQDLANNSKIKISAQKVLEGQTNREYSSGTKDVLYSDRFSVKTELGENKAYSFVKWRFDNKTENQDEYENVDVRNTSASEYNFEFKDYYNEDSEKYYKEDSREHSKDEHRNFVSVTAVWRVKSVLVTLDKNFKIGETENSDINLNFQLSKKSDVIDNDLYQYSVDESLPKFKLSMFGNDKDAYYICGYKFGLRDFSNQTVEWYKKDGVEVAKEEKLEESDNVVSEIEIDLTEQIKLWLESEMVEDNQVVYVMPIIAKKTFSIKFYSGAGSGQHTDNAPGKVYDINGFDTTDNVYTTVGAYDLDSQSINFNDEISLFVNGNLDVQQDLAIDSVFYSRYGHEGKTWNWNNGKIGEIINSHQLNISRELFEEITTKTFEIEVYITWTAKNYEINYDLNEGAFKGSVSTTIVTYDKNVVGVLTASNVTRQHYSLLGWKLIAAEENGVALAVGENDDMMFDGNATLQKGTFLLNGKSFTIIDENNKYMLAGNITLQAIWGPAAYKVKVSLVGGELEGAQNDGKDNYIIWELNYDNDFSNFLDENGNMLEGNPTRVGFNYLGVVVKFGYTILNIDKNTVFNKDLLSFGLADGDYSLNVYVTWEFDANYFALSFENEEMSKSLPDKDYTSEQQNVYVAEYFKEGVVSKNINVTVRENDVSFSLQNADSLTISTSISGETSFSNGFAMTNVGYYYVNFEVSIQDKFNSNTTLQTFIFTLSCRVVDVELEVVLQKFNDAYYITNARRLIEPFVDDNTLRQMRETQSLTTFINLFKSFEGGEFEGANEQEVYNYIIVKYYYIITNNDEYRRQNSSFNYRQWDYAKYKQELEGERSSEIATILQNMRFYTFYNSNESLASVYSTSLFKLSFNGKTPVNLSITDIKLSGIQIVSSLSDVKLIISGEGLPNFTGYSTDTNGNNYIELSNYFFVLPKILQVQNFVETNAVYYSQASGSRRQVQWIGALSEGSDILENGNLFYLIDDLYVSLTIYSSNRGSADVNTEYRFANAKNFLQVEDVVIFENENDRLYEVTSNFKVVLDKSIVFTILSTKGVAKIAFNTEYFTLENENFSILEFADAKLSVSDITYFYRGEEGLHVEKESLTDGAHTIGDEETVLFTLQGNNTSSLEIYLNLKLDNVSFGVTSITFTTSFLQQGYVRFYKWSEEYLRDITFGDKMANSTELSLSKDEIFEKQGSGDTGLIELNYYVVYTDLVKVQYNYNFPAKYYPQSKPYHYFKLGYTTYNNMYKPEEIGFQVAEMTILRGGSEYELSSAFTGENGVFVGMTNISSDVDIYEHLILSVLWRLDQNLEFEPVLNNFKMAVGTYTSLDISNVIKLINMNGQLFPNTTYQWLKDGLVLGNERRLELKDGGSVLDNGNYTIKIEALLDEAYYGCLVSDSPKSISCETSFTLEFVRHQLEAVLFLDSVDFSNMDYYKNIVIGMQYKAYIQTSETEGEMGDSQIDYLNLDNIKGVTFNVTKESKLVTELIDVGEYLINAVIDKNIYEILAGVEESHTFTILPLKVNLQRFSFDDFSKQFNQEDPVFESNLTITKDYILVEEVTISLTREKGENIGEYKLYFDDLKTARNKANYTFVYGEDETELYKNSSKTENQVEIGTFIITNTGVLRLQYQTDETNPATIVADYNENGYDIEFTNDNLLKITTNGKEFKSIEIQLFDVTTGRVILNSEILEIIKNNFDAKIEFFSDEPLTHVVNVANYMYLTTLGEKLNKYFSAITMSPEYTFQIQPKQVTIDSNKLTKVYDGNAILNLNLNGDIINNLEDFEGIYVQAVFETYHVKEEMNVNLKIFATENYTSTNYQLTQSQYTGSITKKNAKLTLEMPKNSFTFGDILDTNLQIATKENKTTDFVKVVSFEDDLQNSLLNILDEGYYTISISLSTSANKHERGFLFKGDYTANVSLDFNDFEVTCATTAFSFQVEALEVSKIIEENLYTITETDLIEEKEFVDYVWIEKTGDNLQIKYVVKDHASGTLTKGPYDFKLKQEETFFDGSVIIKINLNNRGLLVVEETEPLYVRIEDEDILIQTYSGRVWEISASDKILTLTDSQQTFTSNIIFYKKTTTSENVIDQPNITYSISCNASKNVGSYALILRISNAEGYTNVVFEKSYYLTINKKKINYSNLQNAFVKEYDGNSYIEISNFDGKIDSDKVTISANMSDYNVGKNKSLSSIRLNGNDAGNYELNADVELKGEIIKANATASLSKLNYTYGEVTESQGLSFYIETQQGRLIGDELLKAEIQEGTFSSIRKYLNVGSYTVNVTLQSENYQLSGTTSFNITINQFKLSKTFVNNGELEIEYGSKDALSKTSDELYSIATYTLYCNELMENVKIVLKRELGSGVGYYHVVADTYDGTSGDSEFKNYLVEVKDITDEGGVLIKKSSETIYALALDADEKPTNQLLYTYDSKEYDSVNLMSESGVYYILITNKNNSNTVSFKIDFFTFEDGNYVKYIPPVKDLIASLSFDGKIVKDVATYEIYSSNVYSSTNTVKIGGNGTSLQFKIEPQKLTLNSYYQSENAFNRSFDNTNARYKYNASTIFDGVISGDDIAVTVAYYINDYQEVDDSIKYISNYKIHFELSGENKGNYIIETINKTGEITRAIVYITINTQDVEYGTDINQNSFEHSYYTSVPNFDEEAKRQYIAAGRKWDEPIFSVDLPEQLSSAKKVPVGEYDIKVEHEFGVGETSDFEARFVVNGVSVKILDAKLHVVQKKLFISQKAEGETLQNIFTKNYDGTNTANIKEVDGSLKFDLSPAVRAEDGTQDEVEIDNAYYDGVEIGSNLDVKFVLKGKDSSNYFISPWTYGVIRAIVVAIKFNYANAKESDVERAGYNCISGLNFPFVSKDTLTSNSTKIDERSGRNFPNNLYGYLGHVFTGWTMNFANSDLFPDDIANFEMLNQDQISWLENVISKLKLKNLSEIDGQYLIQVGNDDLTIKFLNELLSDDQNTLGYYYMSPETKTITFTANFNEAQYNIIVQMENENGETSLISGVFNVNDEMNRTSYQGGFSYGDVIVIKTKANPHFSFVSFYVNGHEQNSSGIDGEYIKLELSSASSDLNVRIRFAVQKVKVVLDLKNNGSVIGDLGNFVLDDDKYVWNTDYVSLQNFAFSRLPEIEFYGYNLIKFICKNLENEIEITDFSNMLAECVKDETTNSTTLEILPQFEALDVEVTFHFYEGKDIKETLKFGDLYSSANAWNNTEYPGYTFKGWFLNGEGIDEQTTITTLGDKILTAQYKVNSYNIVITLENAIVEQSNRPYEQMENVYTVSEVEFGENITFTIAANDGYEFKNVEFPTIKGVDFKERDGKVYISINMPNNQVEISLSAKPKTNIVMVTGDHITNLAYDTGETETKFSNSFEIQSGIVFTVKINAALGYIFTDNCVDINGEADVNIQTEETEIKITFLNGIKNDVSINVTTSLDENDVLITFRDISVVERVSDGNYSYTNLNQGLKFKITTGNNLILYVKYSFGYVYDRATSPYDIEAGLISEGGYQGYYKITIKNIAGDGNVEIFSNLQTFQVKILVKSVDAYGEDSEIVGNIVLLDGQPMEKDGSYYLTQGLYLSRLNLSVEANSDLGYKFAGFSSDGKSIDLSEETPYQYQIIGDATIYAIFSVESKVINLAVVSRRIITSGAAGNFSPTYKEVSGGRFTYEGSTITNFEIFYGTEKIITFELPRGYYFIGIGYYFEGEFNFLEQNASYNSSVDVSISSSLLGNLDLTYRPVVYMVVAPYEIRFNVKTKIQVKNKFKDDIDVGTAELVAEDGSNVNEYGYIDGTNVHYLNNNDINHRNFVVVAYTGDGIYLKVNLEKTGYNFYGIQAQSGDVIIAKQNIQNMDVYKITNFFGSINAQINIDIIFKPNLNILNFDFVNNNVLADAGSYEVDGGGVYDDEIYTSSSGHSTITVSAYTDSQFNITAYIKLGFYVNEIKIIGIENLDVEIQPYIVYNQDKIEQTGFVGEIRFSVKGFNGIHDISIIVLSSSYKVLLKQNKTTLAEISNVQYNTYLDFSVNNKDNIKILDNRLRFVGGYLKTIVRERNCNFMGYFTFPDGAGKQYVNSLGEACARFLENGYSLNQITKRYDLADNVYYNIITGEFEIALFAYNSFLKTRITFEFEPNLNTSITAMDIVSGVDYSNSWFYEAQPLNIEVEFGSNIYFNAPTISGYKFYKFIIKQKNSADLWFEDVISYSEHTMWSTNEMDNFVECVVQIVYFAQVDVRILGGKGDTRITQPNSDIQAMLLMEQNYVDTTKDFTILAIPDAGYKFENWQISTGNYSISPEITLRANSPMVLILRLKGHDVTLDFGDDKTGYDTTFGQIENMTISMLDNTSRNVILGNYNAGKFTKDVKNYTVHVGDVITFNLKIDFGFSVIWKNIKVNYLGYQNGYHSFTWTIDAFFADKVVEIYPTFNNEIISIYINRSFAPDQIIDGAIDLNNVDRAGFVEDISGNKVDYITFATGTNIDLNIVVNKRYSITNIYLSNYGNKYEIEIVDGKLLLTKEYLKENNIFGMINLDLTFVRIYHADTIVADTDILGKGTKDNPYKIYDVEDLVLIMQLVNSGAVNENGVLYSKCQYVLMANLDLSDKFWTPIGTEEFKFGGSFNFNGHHIDGINLAKEYSPIYYNGLFGYLDGAEIITAMVNLWYIWLIVALVLLLLILLIVLLIINRNKKKRREELSKK